MMPAFDFSSDDSVKAHAEAIYGRLANGTMPCDADGPQSQVTLLRTWIEQGFPR